MAFLPLTSPPGDGGSIRPTHAAPSLSASALAVSHGFAPMEWQIIQLARRDTMSSLAPPTHWDRLTGWIFGHRANPRLANFRLEILRQLAVEAWHRGYSVRPAFLNSFLKAGFTEGQLETLLASISAQRRFRAFRSKSS